MSDTKPVEYCLIQGKLNKLKPRLTQWQYLAIKNFLEYLHTEPFSRMAIFNKSLYYGVILPLTSKYTTTDVVEYVINGVLCNKEFIHPLLLGTTESLTDDSILTEIFDIITHSVMFKTNTIKYYKIKE